MKNSKSKPFSKGGIDAEERKKTKMVKAAKKKTKGVFAAAKGRRAIPPQSGWVYGKTPLPPAPRVAREAAEKLHGPVRTQRPPQ